MRPSAAQREKWSSLSTGEGLDREAFGAVPINEAIRASDMLAQQWATDPRPDVRSHCQQRAKEYQNYSRLLCYLRDTFNVGSIAEALDAIAARQIGLPIIKVWAFELFPGQLPPTPLAQALINAYPEIAEAMTARRSEHLFKSLEESRRLIADM